MTLNTVKPRSAISHLSPSMVSATDLLLGLVMTPSEDCVLSGIRLPFEMTRGCAGWESSRCLIFVQNRMLARSAKNSSAFGRRRGLPVLAGQGGGSRRSGAGPPDEAAGPLILLPSSSPCSSKPTTIKTGLGRPLTAELG